MTKRKKEHPEIGRFNSLSPAERAEEVKDSIIAQFAGFIRDDDDIDELCRYILHCGITPEDINREDGDWPQAVLCHYETRHGYDLERAAQDLLRWPPVAARLKELQRESQAKKEHRAAQERSASRRRKVNGARNGTQVPT